MGDKCKLVVINAPDIISKYFNHDETNEATLKSIRPHFDSNCIQKKCFRQKYLFSKFLAKVWVEISWVSELNGVIRLKYEIGTRLPHFKILASL